MAAAAVLLMAASRRLTRDLFLKSSLAHFRPSRVFDRTITMATPSANHTAALNPSPFLRKDCENSQSFGKTDVEELQLTVS
jgi:hypothetical protein